MSITLLMLTALLGCGSPTEPTPQPKPAPGQARKPPVRAKAKTGNMAPAKNKAPRGKAPRRPLPKPVGAAGPVDGVLQLTVATPDAAPEEPPADAPADEEPPADAPADGDAAEAKTKASLTLSWGDDGTAEVELGEVEATCEEIEPSPVGPEGQQRTPTWTVSCTTGETTYEMYILQVKSVLAVVRGTPTGNEAKPMDYKPVRRVRLAAGATIRKKE